MLIGHVDAEEDFAVEAESTLEASQTPGQCKVSEDMILRGVPGLHYFLAEFALPGATALLQFTVWVETINCFFLDHNLN